MVNRLLKSTVENIGRDDLVDYYKTYFKPNVAYLVVVGDVTEDRAREACTNLFRELGKGRSTRTSLQFPSGTGRRPGGFCQ